MTKTRRRGVIIAAALIGGAVLTFGTVQAVRPDVGGLTAAPPPVSAAAESSCGLRGTQGVAAEGATAATWEAVGAYSLPVSETDGPGVRVPSGPWSCFARTPSGAVLAGLVISWRAAGAAENWQDVIRAQTLPGPGQDAALADGLGSPELVTVRGFDVAAYTEDRATIRYYLHTPAIDASCTEDLTWSEGDWRLVLGEDGSTSSGCSRGAPDTFTPWGPR